jgi:cytoskeletal protein CcmA (bactofilin family)
MNAQNVSVAGALKGTVKAAGRLEILSNGRVWGDISVASFLIDEGGFFRGQSIMPLGIEVACIQAHINYECLVFRVKV